MDTHTTRASALLVTGRRAVVKDRPRRRDNPLAQPECFAAARDDRVLFGRENTSDRYGCDTGAKALTVFLPECLAM